LTYEIPYILTNSIKVLKPISKVIVLLIKST